MRSPPPGSRNLGTRPLRVYNSPMENAPRPEPGILLRVDRKYCFCVSLLYFLSVVFANFMAMVFPVSMQFPVPSTESMGAWLEFMGSHELATNLLTAACFLVPSAVCLSHCFSILSVRDDAEAARKMVNLPLRFSVLGVLGWAFNFVMEVSVLLCARAALDIRISFILATSALFLVIQAVFSFMVSYFVLETVNRTNVLPRILPGGNVSRLPGVKQLSLGFKFLIFFVAVSLFPILFLLSSLVSVQLNNGIAVDFETVLMSALLLCCGAVLTVVFLRLFTAPLEKLIESTRRIKAGDYSGRVEVVSNDELGILSDTFNDMTDSLREKEFIRDTFGKVVDPFVRDHLLGGNIALGGETRDVTVMFCDIRGFTSMSENMRPEKIVSMLNSYFTELGKCVSRNHGIINKYIGDAVMAIFGAPVESANHAMDAYNAAVQMREALRLLNRTFAAQGLPPLAFGIGLHSGNVLAGNIGAENRMEYTVIGDTVNTASRIESLCKSYGADFLMSESTAERIGKGKGGAETAFRFVDEAEIRGRTEKVRLFSW